MSCVRRGRELQHSIMDQDHSYQYNHYDIRSLTSHVDRLQILGEEACLAARSALINSREVSKRTYNYIQQIIYYVFLQGAEIPEALLPLTSMPLESSRLPWGWSLTNMMMIKIILLLLMLLLIILLIICLLFSSDPQLFRAELSRADRGRRPGSTRGRHISIYVYIYIYMCRYIDIYIYIYRLSAGVSGDQRPSSGLACLVCGRRQWRAWIRSFPPSTPAYVCIHVYVYIYIYIERERDIDT